MSNRGYLSFTKKERSGIIMLVVIVLIVAIVPKYLFPEKKVAVKFEQTQGEDPHKEKSRYRREDSGSREHHGYSTRSEGALHLRARTRDRPLPVVEINTADTTEFIALPGIGSKLAARIVLFREKLGGYYTVGQIREVYGLQDSVFQKIKPILKCDAAAMKKININSAAKEDLQVHPYIRWHMANVLVQYRTMHGPFQSAGDLLKIENIDSGAVQKLTPYLRFD